MVTRHRERLLQDLISQVRERTFPYEEREKGKINWNAYDKAQCREIVEVLNFIRELVNKAEERVAARSDQKGKAFGRPPEIRSSDVAKVLLMQTYFGVSNRVAEGYAILFSEKLGLHDEFSYKTIERGYDDEKVKKLLGEVFTLTNEPVNGLEEIFSVDGTGHSTSNKQNYEEDRSKQRSETGVADAFPKGRRNYVANVAIIGTKYKLFASWIASTDHRKGERTLFEESFPTALALHPTMNALLGDGIYANRPTCRTVSEAGVEPVFLPARNVTFKKKKVSAWVKMLERFVTDPQDFLRAYHGRSISETGFSMEKRAFPKPILKRLPVRKETESFLRGLCHNVKRLCYIKFLCTEVNLSFTNQPNLLN